MATLSSCLHPDSAEPAIIVSGKDAKTVSHSLLAENVSQVQQALDSRGVRTGKRVALILSNPHLLTVAFLSLTLNSCIAAPLNYNFKGPEFESYYRDLDADLVIVDEAETAKSGAAFMAARTLNIPIATVSVSSDSSKGPVVQINFLDDSTSGSGRSNQTELASNGSSHPEGSTSALLLHTSGTTGRPKSVLLTHKNLTTSIRNIVSHYNFAPSDRTPVIMPLFHIHGIVAALLTPLFVGSAVIFPPTPTSGLTPSFLRDAAEYACTWYTATPTLHRLILKMKGGETAPTFRFVRSCSSPLDADLLQRLEDRFGCVVVEAYAMTEAAHQVCSNPADKAKRKVGSVGPPTGVEVKIFKEDTSEEVERGGLGEVCVQGGNVMDGYLENQEANEKGFINATSGEWFRTGDQGKLDGEGYLTLTGRLKELINKGGEKIGPVELDNVVNQHEGVAEAVAFAMPDEMYGEEVGLAVVLREGQEVEERVLKKWIGERVAQMKVPKRVFFVEKIPKTAVGKMQRSLVAKTILEPQG